MLFQVTDGPDQGLYAIMAEEEIEHLKIDWDRSQALVSALKDNLDKAPFADVKLLLDSNESFDVHQVVLSQYSRFLTKLFRNRACCKCKGDHCTQREPVQIHLHDVKKETLQNLLAIIYVGEVQFEDDEAQRNFCSVIKMLGIRFPTSSGLELSKLAGYEKPSKEQEDFEACRDADEENSMLRNLLKTPSKDNNSEAIEMNPEIHMDEGDDEGEFLSCVNCDFIASSQKDLYNHSLSCNTEKPDQDIIETEEPATCQFCQSTCSNKDDLASHYCQAHFSKHLKKEFGHLPACPDCGASFPDSEDLMLHIGVEHEKVSDRFLV